MSGPASLEEDTPAFEGDSWPKKRCLLASRFAQRPVTLIEAAENRDPVLGTAVALAALTGARRGELVALRWSDIDLVNSKVKIARSL